VAKRVELQRVVRALRFIGLHVQSFDAFFRTLRLLEKVRRPFATAFGFGAILTRLGTALITLFQLLERRFLQLPFQEIDVAYRSNPSHGMSKVRCTDARERRPINGDQGKRLLLVRDRFFSR
jgi:hypothetical protein